MICTPLTKVYKKYSCMKKGRAKYAPPFNSKYASWYLLLH